MPSLIKDLTQLSKDTLSNEVEQYSLTKKQANSEIRRGVDEILGYTANGGKVSHQMFRERKNEFFAFIEDSIAEKVDNTIRWNLGQFVEYRNLAFGDENLFKVPTNDMFRVALISQGNANIRRQRLREGLEFKVQTEPYGVKIGEELHRILAGRVDWDAMVQGVGESMAQAVNTRIYDAIVSSYGKFNSQYHVTMNPKEDDIIEMAMHIEARTGERVGIYGTKLALRRIAPKPEDISDNMRDNKNALGYYGTLAGIPMHEIPQSHKYGKNDKGEDEFAIDNDMLLLLPLSTDKFIKVVNEGEPIMQDNNGSATSDMMNEYFIVQQIGFSVLTSKVFGFIKLA